MIAPNAVIDEYRSGATIVLQGLHHTDPHLARTANNLALDLDHPVQINAYLSPAAARGLDLHFDYHDVFVVQLGGSKRWRVWEPLDAHHRPGEGQAPHRRCRRSTSSASRCSTSRCAPATASTCPAASPTRPRPSTTSRTT